MMTDWNTRFSFFSGLVPFFPHYNLELEHPATETGHFLLFHMPPQGTLSTQLCKKLCCMEEQGCTLEIPEFSARKNSSPQCRWEQSAHMKIITGMLLQEHTCPVRKAKQLCCLEMKFFQWTWNLQCFRKTQIHLRTKSDLSEHQEQPLVSNHPLRLSAYCLKFDVAKKFKHSTFSHIFPTFILDRDLPPQRNQNWKLTDL